MMLELIAVHLRKRQNSELISGPIVKMFHLIMVIGCDSLLVRVFNGNLLIFYNGFGCVFYCLIHHFELVDALGLISNPVSNVGSVNFLIGFVFDFR